MAEIRINTTGGLKLYDADNSHYAQIVAGTITSNVDAITLGHDTVTIADNLSLGSDSAILKFGADTEIALTHVADTGLKLTDSGGTPTLQLHDANESIASDGSKVIITSGGTAFSLPTSDGSNGQVLTTNGCGVLSFATASSADPSSADGDSLGTASAEWSDLYLADGGIIYFGNDQDIRLTHNADKGLIIKHSATADDKPVILTLQTGETDMAQDDVMGKIEFQAPDEGTGTDAVLVSAAIQAVAEGDFSSSSNATRLEFMTGSSEAATTQMSISSGGIVGIGAVPTGDLGVGLHIKTADSGASANSDADEFIIETGSGSGGMSILSANDGTGDIYFGDDGSNASGYIQYNHTDNSLRFGSSGGQEKFRIFSSALTVGKTGESTTTVGHELRTNGLAIFTTNTTQPVYINRQGDDGTLVSLRQADSEEGTISVSGGTVSYNAFAGSHWSRLADNSKPTILRGTVMESISTLMDWYQVEYTKDSKTLTKYIGALPNGKKVGDSHTVTVNGVEETGVISKEDNERLPMCKISDTEDSKAVYGVFMDWDGDDDTINDMYVTALGAFVVRIHKDETVAIGDYLQSKGDGTAKKQADDILRASTIAKVTSTEKTITHSDGSYCVPCTLHCG